MILAIWATVERRAGSQSSQGESIKSRQVSSYRSSYLLPPLLPPTAAPISYRLFYLLPQLQPQLLPPLLQPTSYRRSYILPRTAAPTSGAHLPALPILGAYWICRSPIGQLGGLVHPGPAVVWEWPLEGLRKAGTVAQPTIIVTVACAE